MNTYLFVYELLDGTGMAYEGKANGPITQLDAQTWDVSALHQLSKEELSWCRALTSHV